MTKFRSRYKLSIIAIISFVFLFYGFFIFIFLNIIKENIEQANIFNEWKPIFLLVLFLMLFSFTIKHFLKYFFKVIITESEIIIGKRNIKLEEIKHLSIREKIDFMFLFYPFTYEAAVLYLKNGEKIPIGIENYTNGNLIQHNLKQINNHIHDPTKPIKILEKEPEELKKKEIINYSTGVEYMRSPYLSINNYLCVSIILFIIWVIPQPQNPDIISMIFLILGILFFYFLLVIQNHYFILTNNHLIVKNVFLPIKKKIFNLDEIEIIETETLPKQETALKITTKNFKIHRFQSVLMDDELFSALMEDVKYNIANFCSENPISG